MASVFFDTAPDPQYARALQVIEFFRDRSSLFRRCSYSLFKQEWWLLPGFANFPVAIIEQVDKHAGKGEIFRVESALLWLFVILGAFRLWGRTHSWAEANPAVFLQGRCKHLGFWGRHEDTLKKLIFLVIGALLTLLAGWVKTLFR